jgi:hypothetical protein
MFNLAAFCTTKNFCFHTANLTFNLGHFMVIIMAFIFFNESNMLTQKEFLFRLALIVLAVVSPNVFK